MLQMAPNRLAKRLMCSAKNAQTAQMLIVAILVKNHRQSLSVNTDALQVRISAMVAKVARRADGELADIFRALAG